MPIAPLLRRARQGETQVSTLRLRTPAANAAGRAAVRRAVERELAGADLTLPGLPPGALLLVRKLEDPLPGSLGRGGFRPPADWERAVRERLARLARDAARPDARGRVPPDSPAVLLADSAEHTAWRVRARARGDTLPWADAPAAFHAPPEIAVEELLAQRPRELPAILARLAAWGEARRVLQALPRDGARRLLTAVVQTFDLPPELAGEITDVSAFDVSPRPEAASSRRDELPEEPEPTREAVYEDPKPPRLTPPSGEAIKDPWRDVAHRLGLDHAPPTTRALAGVCFGLLTSLTRLRSPDSVRGAERWWREIASPDSPASPSAVRPDDGAEPTSTTGNAPRRRTEAAPGETPEDQPRSIHRTPDDSNSIEHERLEVTPLPRDEAALSESPTEAERPVDSEELADLPVSIPSDASFPTAWGGVLYLLHVLDDLGLPEACEEDWRLASTAGGWGCLDLVARGLLAHRPEALDDPLFEALAELADWHPPDREPVSAQGSHPGLSAAALKGWDIAGWEAPGSDESLGALQGRPRGSPVREGWARVSVELLPNDCPPYLGRWLSLVTPILRRRLLLALGPDAANGDDPVERLLAVPARVHVTSSHVDLVTGLDHIWLPARRAGLDRDPGWLPRLGRVVLFHFEEGRHD